MALGPKEMGAAIIANLKTKTGRDLDEWLGIVRDSGVTDKRGLTAFLKEQGLGHFKAQSVAAHFLGAVDYEDEAEMVAALFEKYPEQRRLMDEINSEIVEKYGLSVKPCKGYVPVYSKDRTIRISYKPTPDGLYIGLVGESFPFGVVPHKKSLGGTERMAYGIYADNAIETVRKLEAVLNRD